MQIQNKLRKTFKLSPKPEKIWNKDKTELTVVDLYPDFSIKSSTQYKEAALGLVKHGDEKIYSQDKSATTNSYNAGLLKETNKYDTSGKLVSNIKYLEDKDLETTFSNGTKLETCKNKDGTIEYKDRYYKENQPYTGTICLSSSRKRSLFRAYINGFAIGADIGFGHHVAEQGPDMQAEFERQNALLESAKAAIKEGNSQKLDEITKKALENKVDTTKADKAQHFNDIRTAVQPLLDEGNAAENVEKPEIKSLNIQFNKSDSHSK